MQLIEVPARFPDGPGSLANVPCQHCLGKGEWGLGSAPRFTENKTVISQFTENINTNSKVTLETD